MGIINHIENGKIIMDAIYEKDTIIYFLKHDESSGFKDLFRKILIVSDKNPIKVSEEYIAKAVGKEGGTIEEV
jgi:hypothetical protein